MDVAGQHMEKSEVFGTSLEELPSEVTCWRTGLFKLFYIIASHANTSCNVSMPERT